MAEKRHVYDYEVDLASDTAPARVISMVAPGSKVLEVGAGPGAITRHLVETLKCDVAALEVDPVSVEMLRAFTPQVYNSDLNVPGWSREIAEKSGSFDYLIAADVLEHLLDPWTVLDEMKSLLKDGGSIILSVPHVGHAAVVACMLDEDFQYGPWGLLDRTHLRFFGVKNIQSLINGAGLKIDEAEFVVRTPEMTEFTARWKRIPQNIRDAIQRNRYCHVLQVVARTSVGYPQTVGLDLMALRPEPLSQEIVEHWTRVMKRNHDDAGRDHRSPIEEASVKEPRSSRLGRARRTLNKVRRWIGE